MTIKSILSIASRSVLSLTVGGGKTSFMFHLARLLTATSKKILTTTTKIFTPTVLPI